MANRRDPNAISKRKLSAHIPHRNKEVRAIQEQLKQGKAASSGFVLSPKFRGLMAQLKTHGVYPPTAE